MEGYDKKRKISDGNDVNIEESDLNYDSDDQFLENCGINKVEGSGINGGNDSNANSTVTGGTKGLPAKNLMAERRRRKKLNDRLYMLRSVVPKISKMDRASILGDAIDCLKELLQKINDLHNELESTPSNSSPTPSSTFYPVTPTGPRLSTLVKEELCPPATFPNPGSIPTGQLAKVEVRLREGRAVNILMFCGRRPGLLLSTMRALDNLGLDIQQAVISCFNGFALDIFRAEQCKQGQDLHPDQIKAILLDSAAFHGVIYCPTKLTRDQFFNCKLTLGSRYVEVCKKIVSFLNEKEMEYLVEETQFGNLIACAKYYTNSNQILWFLMSRQTFDSECDEFWMVYRKRPLRFSLLEYCLLTGLNCSKLYPTIPEDDEFRYTYFDGNHSICVGDLVTAMDEFENEFGEEVDVEKLKLACLFFVASVLGPQRKSKLDIVQPEWITLVNDFESFINYPWGRLAFEEVIFGLRRDLEAKVISYEKLVARRQNDPDFRWCSSFHITGFIQPLQILAYEYFPAVVEIFARRREGPNVPIPRMCHWLTKKWNKNSAPSIDDVNNAFKSVHSKDIFGMLIPTMDELCSVHYMTGDFVDSSPSVVFNRITELLSQRIKVVCSQDPLVNPHDEIDTQNEDQPLFQPFTYTYFRSSRDRIHTSSRLDIGQAHVNPTSPHGYTSPLRHTSPRHASPPLMSHPLTSFHKDRSSEDIYEVRLTNLEDRLSVMQKEQSDMMDVLRNMQKDQTDGFSHILDVMRRMQEEISSLKHDGETSRNEEMSRREDVNLEQMNVLQNKESLNYNFQKASGFTQRWTVDEELMSDETLNEIVLKDVMSQTFEKKIRNFTNRSWSRVSLEINVMTDNTRISGLISSYDQKSFLELGTPGSWLNESHIQECSRGLLELQKTYIYFMSQDVSLMDVDFHQLVLAAFNEGGPTNIENLMPYVRGDVSDWPCVSWDKAKITLIPFHLPGHWVLLKFLPRIRKITVMDSDRSVDRSGKTLNKHIRYLKSMIPHILAAMGISGATETEWNISRPEDFPTQKVSGECGVYVIAAAGYTMCGENAYHLNDDKIQEFRHFCCCCIWYKLWSLT